ncbi:cation transporter [Luteimonas sp. RD2P54]|uniref:Cation transporter n=1 Tax=Luteimonas endophytica TaxID=3042023 RepID=A0ABT6J8G1_9GAMM|nr:cation transporter [Luteimonas endophytica]MDH5823105.1 cation transporter [Luteimonas endophytica]
MSGGDAVKLRDTRPLPAAQREALAHARRLCWWTLLWMSLVSAMMYAVMGGSQTMKTAFIEDMLSLLPPVAFLVASRFQAKPVDQEYVNGRTRAFDINFLIAGAALTGFGLMLVWDGLHTLATATHPVIGTVSIGDTVVWKGWLMIGALLLSAIPPAILGRRKLKLSRTLALKPLHADADTGKADWSTALAGVAGIVGIGFGFWWADAAAALFISGSVLHDGLSNLKGAVRDMHDARPQRIDRSEEDPLVGRVRDAVCALDWVQACRVRFHEEGFRLCGVVFVRAAAEATTPERLRQAHDAARAVHWRIDEVIVTLLGEEPTDSSEEGGTAARD